MSGPAAGPSPRPLARSTIRVLLLLSLTLGTGLCAAGYWLDGPAAWAAGAAVVPALLWAATHRRDPRRAADTGLVSFVALAGLGLWLGIAVGWMVAVVVAGLAAWDLAHFERRLAPAGHVEDRGPLEAQHLVHLLPVLAAGLLLALLGTSLHLKIGFLPALLLGVLAIAGLARAFVYLVRDHE